MFEPRTHHAVEVPPVSRSISIIDARAQAGPRCAYATPCFEENEVFVRHLSNVPSDRDNYRGARRETRIRVLGACLWKPGIIPNQTVNASVSPQAATPNPSPSGASARRAGSRAAQEKRPLLHMPTPTGRGGRRQTADRGAACWPVASVCCSTPGRRKTA